MMLRALANTTTVQKIRRCEDLFDSQVSVLTNKDVLKLKLQLQLYRWLPSNTLKDKNPNLRSAWKNGVRSEDIFE